MKMWSINIVFTVAVCLLCISIPASSAEQVQAKTAQAKRTVVRHKRAHRVSRKSIAVKPAPPVLDTTCIDTTDIVQQTLTSEINKWAGTRYHRGGMSRKGIDCSGFTYQVFRKGFTLPLPRTSSEQARIGEEVDHDQLQFGDLLFFYSKRLSKHKRINHVAIYVGDGNFVHSCKHRGVSVASLSEPYYSKHFACAKRVLPSGTANSHEEPVEE